MDGCSEVWETNEGDDHISVGKVLGLHARCVLMQSPPSLPISQLFAPHWPLEQQHVQQVKQQHGASGGLCGRDVSAATSHRDQQLPGSKFDALTSGAAAISYNAEYLESCYADEVRLLLLRLK